MSNSDWRTSDRVGRTSRPDGVLTTRPRHSPAVIRVSATRLIDVENRSVAVHRLRKGRPGGEIGFLVEPSEGRLFGPPAERDVEQIGGEHLGQPVLAQADEL